MSALLLAFALAAPSASFTDELWEHIRPLYHRTLEHPFLKGLTDGTLPRDRFDFYLAQDADYLSSFSRALSLLAAKAPREDWSLTLNRHAVEALEVERQLHDSLLKENAKRPPMAPTNRAYTNHLLATVSMRPFGEGLAAMLPCYWIYWEVGKELKKKGSKNPDYQRWIDQYAGEEYGASVRQVLAMMNAEAQSMNAAQRAELKKLFEISARYEYMFWDMAWRMEEWPPEQGRRRPQRLLYSNGFREPRRQLQVQASGEDDDPRPPKLKRGPRSEKGDERAGPRPESRPIPPVREIVTDEHGRVIEIRGAGAGDPVIEKARELAFEHAEMLPDFIVEQHTVRYTTNSRPPKWKRRDRLFAEVLMVDGRESYHDLRRNGRQVSEEKIKETGSWSLGEWAVIQLDVLSRATNADFAFRQMSEAGGRPARMYDYTVEQRNSHWKVDFEGEILYPAYWGSVWIDEENNRVLRIEMISRDIPASYPFQAVEMTVDYGKVEIAGDNYLMPVRGENLACKRYSLYCTRNEIEFRNYRKFTAESVVTTTDSDITFEGEEKRPKPDYVPPTISPPEKERKRK